MNQELQNGLCMHLKISRNNLWNVPFTQAQAYQILYRLPTDWARQAVVKCSVMDLILAKSLFHKPFTNSIFEMRRELASNSLYPIQPSAVARQAGKGHNRCPMQSPFKSAWLCSMVTPVNATHHFHSSLKHRWSFFYSFCPVPLSNQGQRREVSVPSGCYFSH